MGFSLDPLVNRDLNKSLLWMKTTTYNPSPLEENFANALHKLQEQIELHLDGNKIVNVESNLNRDNPMVKFSMVDGEGDPHEVVIRIIQIPDKF
jgi:hypothetical protein